jgi:hypothetical protein
MAIQLIDDIPLETPIYRYIDLATFIAFVETKRTYLTRIIDWDDTWEAPYFQAGDLLDRDYGEHHSYYGQCWTLLPESDALWRIYSPEQEGIRLQSSIGKLGMLDSHVADAIIGRVRYFTDAVQFHELGGNAVGLRAALFKRQAFEHENEIRLLTKRFGPTVQVGHQQTHVPVPLDPAEFLDGITLDPRAANWKVDALRSYAERVGLAAVPHKSSLYQGNVGSDFRSLPPKSLVAWDSKQQKFVQHERSE